MDVGELGLAAERDLRRDLQRPGRARLEVRADEDVAGRRPIIAERGAAAAGSPAHDLRPRSERLERLDDRQREPVQRHVRGVAHPRGERSPRRRDEIAGDHVA